MRGEDAFAILGLRPGAGREEVDRAYRRLIKRYHPDSSDGDVGRAAEINRAYAELRRASREPVYAPAAAMVHPGALVRQPGRLRGTMAGVLAIIAAVAIALWASIRTDGKRPWADLPLAGTGEDHAPRALVEKADLDEPLAVRLIDLSLADAMRFSGGRDSRAAAEFSRSCLRRMATSPSVPLFDSCAAFDEAIAILMVGDNALTSGAFNPSAVTARQVSAARMLSADYLEAESRLQRIRTRVQLQLLDGGGKMSVPRSEPIRVAERQERTIVAEPRSYRPSQPVRYASTVRHAPPPVVRPAMPAPAPRVETPRPARIAAAASTAPPVPSSPKTETGASPKPAWQQPLKPAWQRPLPARD